jgi:type II secretory pathway component PulF
MFFLVFGFFRGLFLACFGLPILFWLFVKFMNQVREGWDDALVAMPILGPLYERIFRPETYFKMDTALMFQSAVESAVQEVIGAMTSAKGIRPLTELERKPILREFYRR